MSSPEKNDTSPLRIVATDEGPYLVYGRPPLAVQVIMPDAAGESWYYDEGRSFATDAEPTALCRCGTSKNAPYCDGSHARAQWEPHPAPGGPTHGEREERIEGPGLTLHDQPAYCAFARFCHPYGDVWTLTARSGDADARRMAVREASMCPAGRLTAADRDTGTRYEFRFAPSLGLLEDPAIDASGGLWVRGGIRIERADGSLYPRRNRVLLCRCGQSLNKPFCDGTHAAIKWHDGIAGALSRSRPRTERESAAAPQPSPAGPAGR